MPSPDAPLTSAEIRSNRVWILVLVGFSVIMLLGSVVFAVVRMPAMLAAQIREAKSVEVEIQRAGSTTKRTLEAKEARESLAVAIERAGFSLSFGSPPREAKETIVLRVVAPNRTSEVTVWDGQVLKAGFTFRAGAKVELLPER